MHMSEWKPGQKHSLLINHFESPINRNVTVRNDAEKGGPGPDCECFGKAGAPL